jgi:nucleoside-diphosphate-sugar epimerase
MKAFCIGSAGFIGSHLADALIEKGIETYGIDYDWAGKIGNANPKLNILGNQEAIFTEMPDKVDIWYHLACTPDITFSQREPSKYFESEFEQVQEYVRMAEIAKRDNGYPNKFIYVSTSGMYFSLCPNEDAHSETYSPIAPHTPYAAVKVAAEAMVACMSMPHLCVRPFNVFGPRQRIGGTDTPVVPSFFRQIVAGGPILVDGTGEQAVDFVYVKDAATWLAGLADEGCHFPKYPVSNLGRGVSVTINELAEMCMEASGIEVEIEHRKNRKWYFTKSKASTLQMQRIRELEYTPMLDALKETWAYYRDLFEEMQ